ncbi:MAG: UDP-3-O-(3-hydroxymyristoyl)glucosamine N-acyltransferase [Bacteroidia bacterium]
MQISVAQLAQLLNGKVVGNPDILLHTVAKIEDGKEGALSFLANMKYESHIYDTKSSVVLVNNDFIPSQEIKATLIKVENAYASFTLLLEQFAAYANKKEGIEEGAVINKSAELGTNLYVGALAYIAKGVKIGNSTQIYPTTYIGDNVTIGENCIIYAGVKIYNDCVIGNNVIIHSGTVIGSDGFGFAPLADRSYKKIPQIGNVIIEDDVEIGSNCSIDRATMGSTILRKGVKLDNLNQVAHNVEIGEHTVMAGQSAIAGSTKIGKYCILAGQVGIGGHLTIADGTVLGAKSGVNSNVKKENQRLFGAPAFEYAESIKASIVYKKLPQLYKTVNELERKINEK